MSEWRRMATSGSITGIERLINEFWPGSGYTVDAESLAVNRRDGTPKDNARVVCETKRKRTIYAFEVRS